MSCSKFIFSIYIWFVCLLSFFLKNLLLNFKRLAYVFTFDVIFEGIYFIRVWGARSLCYLTGIDTVHFDNARNLNRWLLRLEVILLPNDLLLFLCINFINYLWLLLNLDHDFWVFLRNDLSSGLNFTFPISNYILNLIYLIGLTGLLLKFFYFLKLICIVIGKNHIQFA